MFFNFFNFQFYRYLFKHLPIIIITLFLSKFHFFHFFIKFPKRFNQSKARYQCLDNKIEIFFLNYLLFYILLLIYYFEEFALSDYFYILPEHSELNLSIISYFAI